MMHPAQMTPQLVDSVLTTSSEVDKELCYSAAPANPVSKVLDDDDLLMEIMIRLGFPTSLVRVALVCKRWYRHASDPIFLRRFRKLHPPHLLGLYVDIMNGGHRHFVPILPRPIELASVFRRARFTVEGPIMDIRYGIVAVGSYKRESGATYYPLCPERGMSTVTPLPPHPGGVEGNMKMMGKLVLREDGLGFSYYYVLIGSNVESPKSTVHVYALQDGVWNMHASAVTKLPCEPKRRSLLVGNKIYILALSNDILVLDLTTSTFSTFQRPKGLVVSGERKDTLLSRADDHSSVYLMHLNGFQLCIWLYKEDKCLLVDTICLREMLSNLGMSDDTTEEKHITTPRLNQVGENAEFALLKIGRCVLYLDIRCRTVRKVYNMTSNDCLVHRLDLLTMVWPPKFPALKDDLARDAK